MSSFKIPPSFDLRALEVFVAVARSGGMTEAGRLLGLTQSAVSQAVANLEGALGVSLIDRSTRPLTLTRQGAILCERAAGLLDDATLAVNATRNPSEEVFESLTIAIFDSLSYVLSAPLVQSLGEVVQRWHIRSGLSNHHEPELRSGGLDMAITFAELLDNETGFEHHPIFSEDFVLALPRALETACDGNGEPDLAALAGRLPFLRYSLRSASGRAVEHQLKRLRLAIPLWLECDSPMAQLALIAQGSAWGMMTPLFCLQAPALLDQVRLIRPTRGRFGRNVALVVREGAFGGLPARIAETSRGIMRETIVPAIGAAAPGMEEAIRIA